MQTPNFRQGSVPDVLPPSHFGTPLPFYALMEWGDVHDHVDNGNSIKKLCEEWSWVDENGRTDDFPGRKIGDIDINTIEK